MPGHGEKQERKQEEAIGALLSCPTIETAAKKIGVHPGTLRAWLKEPEFSEAYRQARQECLSLAIGSLQRLCSLSVQTFAKVMADEQAPAGSRLTAARSALEFALRGSEMLDVEERLQAIEEKLKS